MQEHKAASYFIGSQLPFGLDLKYVMLRGELETCD